MVVTLAHGSDVAGTDKAVRDIMVAVSESPPAGSLRGVAWRGVTWHGVAWRGDYW